MTFHSDQVKKDTFLAVVQQAYGFDLVDLRFLLRGWGGDCYVGESKDGEVYFLKVHDEEINSAFAASSRPFYLPLMDQLHGKGILPNIPHPFPTLDGALSQEVGSQELVITNYIEGEVVGYGELPEPIIATLAESIAVLHTSLPRMAFDRPLVEGFEIAFEDTLLGIIAGLGSISPAANPGQQALRDTLLPRQAELVELFQRLESCQSRARSLEVPKVVCHTDLHGGNLMTGPGGELYILDWENAMIAPREHDLVFFVGDSRLWDIFWPSYQGRCGSLELNPDLLMFYHLRRSLEDIADYLVRIMQGDGGLKRDQDDLWELVRILDGWSGGYFAF